MVSKAFVPVTVPELFTPGRYGLTSVVNWIQGAKHWQAGIQYDAECAGVDVTINPCVISGITIPAKAATYDHTTRGSIPFTLFAEADCSPPGGDDWWTNAQQKVITALDQASPTQLEYTFWTGRAPTGELTSTVYPNLVTSSQVVSSDVPDLLLQPAATLISGVPLDITEGLGALEETVASCWNGEAVIHAPIRAIAALAARGLCYRDGSVLRTYAGNTVVAGRGYPSTIGPNGTTNAAGRMWMFATSPIFGIRDAARARNNSVESFDRSINTLKMIAEQTVILGWKCCLAGVLVTTGGEAAGEPSSPLQDT